MKALTASEYQIERIFANRGDWNGGGGEISLFAVSDMQENELLSGVNPNTDTQLAALDGGKYIAVFVDDVPERTAETVWQCIIRCMTEAAERASNHT